MTVGRDGDAEGRVARRLAPRPSPASCIGVCVHVVTAADAPRPVRSSPPPTTISPRPGCRLLRARRVGPRRWRSARPPRRHALDLLLRQLPADATLFLAGRDDVDAALAAEILLEADRNLEPYQREGIAKFVEAERARTKQAIAARYTDHDAGFERFRARVLGAPAR